MDPKDFWHQFDLAQKEHEKWEKRADKVIKRYRLDGEKENKPSFNILWANVSVQQPSLFSQTPKPDIRRRYRDDDEMGKQVAKILERALEFVMDDGDFFSFGNQTVMDYLLPGRSVAKIRYVPLISKTRNPVPVEQRVVLSPFGEEVGRQYFLEDDEMDPAEVQFQEDGTPFIEQEIEEVVDEHVVIERWPWKNCIHQKAKRWRDVGWVDYISYMNRSQLIKHFGRKAGNEINLSVDASGTKDSSDRAFNPTHAEVHEIWFKASRKVRIAVKDGEEWLKEQDDPLRLNDFFPTPHPLLAVNTNDSLLPIPIFTLYQHQANELDQITNRIAILMKALKLAGLYAGNEKATLTQLFEADENQMIPVADWGAIQAAGGVNGLVDWLPIEQVGKVLTALFREREAIIQQIYELTGIADIQRGATDPRETRGAQVLKAQFSDRRGLTPKQNVELYFRDCLRIAAEIMAEHFSADTLQRMTGLPVPEEAKKLLEDELSRQYRIDIETDSTIAPDEQAEQANMAKALEAITAYVGTIGPMVASGNLPKEASLKLLKVYLRKFKWGREMEEVIEELERQPQQPQPDPEAEKMKAEMQAKQAEMQAEMQMKQQEFQMEMRKLMAELQADQQSAQQELAQDAQEHAQEMQQDREKHELELQQLAEMTAARVAATKAQSAAKPKPSNGNA